MALFNVITSNCPITRGLPTRMTAAAFDRMCATHRGEAEDQTRRPGCQAQFEVGNKLSIINMRCASCRGEREHWPEELAVINLEGFEMSKGKLGSCDLCETKAQLKHTERAGGLDVCSTCWTILSNMDRNADLIVKAARLLDKIPDLAAGLGAPVTVDPDDHAIAEAVRECFGRDLTREQLCLRCREEYETAQAVKAEHDEVMRTLRSPLPGTDNEETLEELANRAAQKMIGDNAELYTLREILQPDEPRETRIRAAERLVREAQAWAALMDRARDAGFAEIAAGEPGVMAATYIMAVNEVMAERDDLRTELAVLRAKHEEVAEVATGEKNAQNVALLRWAQGQLEAGRIGFHIEVREVAA